MFDTLFEAVFTFLIAAQLDAIQAVQDHKEELKRLASVVIEKHLDIRARDLVYDLKAFNALKEEIDGSWQVYHDRLNAARTKLLVHPDCDRLFSATDAGRKLWPLISGKLLPSMKQTPARPLRELVFARPMTRPIWTT